MDNKNFKKDTTQTGKYDSSKKDQPASQSGVDKRAPTSVPGDSTSGNTSQRRDSSYDSSAPKKGQSSDASKTGQVNKSHSYMDEEEE